MLATMAAVAGCSKSADEKGTTAGPTPPAAADYVLSNGKIYTVNEDRPWAEAVAVRGNEIVYIGDKTGLAAFTGRPVHCISS